MALTKLRSPSCSLVPFQSPSQRQQPHTCPHRQAHGPAAPGSRPHETFTAQHKLGNSKIYYLPSLVKMDVSSLLSTWREDKDPREVVLEMSLPSTC